jgi:hypothetical protein
MSNNFINIIHYTLIIKGDNPFQTDKCLISAFIKGGNSFNPCAKVTVQYYSYRHKPVQTEISESFSSYAIHQKPDLSKTTHQQDT